MAPKETMALAERNTYLRLMKSRYQTADRATRSALLDEMQAVTGLHRKYLIGLMHAPGPYRRPRTRERGRSYGPEVEAALCVIGESMDWICAERLQPNLVGLAEQLAHFGALPLTPALREQLGRISVSTLRRILRRVRPETAMLPRPRRGRPREGPLAGQVPVRVIPANQSELGHFEADLVYHGPGNQSGSWLYTLQFIDVLSGWSERFALPGRDFGAVWAGVQAFKDHCPLPVREIHVDNGSEFLNAAFVSHFGEAFSTAALTRGRPGYHNDNRFVEQKNSSLVRAYLGELYLDSHEQLELLRTVYVAMWRYYNLCQPVLRQTERHVHIGPDGVPHLRRRQDRARTPLTRVLEAQPPLSQARVQSLQDLHTQTNPLALKREIHAQLEQLYRLAAQAERRRGSDFG